MDSDGEPGVGGEKPSEFVHVFKAELTGVPVTEHHRKSQDDSRFLVGWVSYNPRRGRLLAERVWGPVSLHSLSATRQKVRDAPNI